jgi:DNA invertase Pin-like site-specific DNA recombinase
LGRGRAGPAQIGLSANILTIHAAVYGRTSPDYSLFAKAQIEHLKGVAAQQGWTVQHEFTDRPISGRCDDRPGQSALIRTIARGSLDKVLLCSIDRIGHTSAKLVRFLEVCRTARVALWLDEQKLDTATGNGLSLFDVSEMITFHQRQSRREQILRGLSAARSLSIRLGRPSVPPVKIEKIKAFLMAGKGVRESARLVGGISPASVCRIRASMKADPGTVADAPLHWCSGIGRGLGIFMVVMFPRVGAADLITFVIASRKTGCCSCAINSQLPLQGGAELYRRTSPPNVDGMVCCVSSRG